MLLSLSEHEINMLLLEIYKIREIHHSVDDSGNKVSYEKKTLP
jgi:hypothetical protein